MEVATSKYALRRHNHRYWAKGDVKTLLDIKEILIDKKWFIIGGTLLGAVREQRLFSHRACLNIAVLDKDKSAFNLLKKIGFLIDENKVKYGYIAVAKREDAYVDTHIFKEVPDGVIVQRIDPKCSPYHVYYAKLPKKFFDKRKSVFIEGKEFPAPNYPEDFLTLTYGRWKKLDMQHCSHKAFKGYIIE